MTSGIYIITNSKDKTVYIGSTISFKKRWGQHHRELRRGAHRNSHLQHAWKKYGESVFEFDILEHLDNPEELYLAEQFWMDIYRLEGKKLYNYGTTARHPMLGTHHTEEHCRNISEGNKGHIVSEETRQKISNTHKGKTLSKEHKLKLSAAKLRDDNPRRGKPLTEEHKYKISISNKGQKRSEETKRKMKEARKGRILSEEHKRNIGKACSKLYPAFIHQDTGEIIIPGSNLAALCREWNLASSSMYAVINGKQTQHKGWELKEQMEQL